MPPPVSRRARRLAAALALVCCAPEHDPLAPVEYAEDLAADIPMTGTTSPLFAEVDTVMRQFVKWRCVGAGTLAISYKGRRVYKRGFGRMNGRAGEVLYPGCGDDESNPFDPDAALTRPDSPMYLGSLTKAITAAVARWLIDERLAASPEPVLRPCAEPPCLATAADVQLLDPALDLLPQNLAEVARGDVPLPVPIVEAPCTEGHDPKYADPRWRTITIGNLISHRSGLTRNARWFAAGNGVIGNLTALRGYTDGGEEPWIAEDAAVRAANTGYASALDAASAWLSARNDDAPVYFVNVHPPDARPLDEIFTLSAGLCLEYNPGSEAKYLEDSLYDPIGQEGQYSNFALTIVGRVIDHLQRARTGGAYLPDFGRPETHWDSALADFLAEKLDVTEGVETAEGILTLGSTYPFPGAGPPAHPVPRIWAENSFYPRGWDEKAPYCVYRDGACDFGEWLKAADGDTSLRPELTWTLLDDTLGFRRVPLWAAYEYANNAAGSFISELPVFLEFAARYNISGRSDRLDNGNGTERTNPLKTTQGHHGALGGGYAIVQQMVGGIQLRTLPPLIDGHLVDDFDHLQPTLITRPDHVDFVVAVNQTDDPRCTSQLGDFCTTEYQMLGTFIEYGLSQVDWAAVDAMLAAQRDEVVGMTFTDGVSHFWFADDHHVAWTGPPDSFPGRDHRRLVLPGTMPYALPSTRIGPDVLAIARDPDGTIVAWYDDGRHSRGTALDLSSIHAPMPFTVAEAHAPDEIVAASIAADGTAHAWYLDGTWSSGTTADLAAHTTGTFDLPDGRAPSDIATITFDPTLPHLVWTRFRDGSTATGTITAPATI